MEVVYSLGQCAELHVLGDTKIDNNYDINFAVGGLRLVAPKMLNFDSHEIEATLNRSVRPLRWWGSANGNVCGRDRMDINRGATKFRRRK